MRDKRAHFQVRDSILGGSTIKISSELRIVTQGGIHDKVVTCGYTKLKLEDLLLKCSSYYNTPILPIVVLATS